MTESPADTAGAARQEGAAFAQSAAGAGQDVAHTAADEASTVADEATTRAKDLARTAQDEVTGQVEAAQRRLIEALRTTGDELGSAGEERSALTAELTRRAAQNARQVADYLDKRGPGDILGDVRTFARNRPGTFLILAGMAGVVAGRVFRSVSAGSAGGASSPENSGGPDASSAYGSGVPAASSAYGSGVPAASGAYASGGPDASGVYGSSVPAASGAHREAAVYAATVAPTEYDGSFGTSPDPDLVAVASAPVYSSQMPAVPVDPPVGRGSYPPVGPLDEPYDASRDQR